MTIKIGKIKGYAKVVYLNLLRSYVLFLSIITTTLALSSCSTSSKKNSQLKVTYEEFQKILSPGSITTLEGQNAFLTVMAKPGDKYPKVYRYNTKTKKFSLEYDHGQRVYYISTDRDNKNIYFHIDNKGDENTGIYRYNPGTKKIMPIFVRKSFKARLLGTDKSGHTLFVLSNHEKKSVYSIYKMNKKGKDIVRLSDGKTNFTSALVSSDGHQLLASRYLSNNENQVFHIDVKKKRTRLIFKKKKSVFWPSFLAKNNKAVYGVSDDRSDRKGCARIQFNQPNRIQYVVKKRNKDIYCSYGERSKLYYISESYKGRTELNLYKKMFKNPIKIPQLYHNQSVSAIGYDRTNSQMLLQYGAANNPGTLHNFNIKTDKENFVLDYNTSTIPKTQLAESFDFDYKSFDGMKIHGIIYAHPDWKTSGKRYPMVLWPHGGPDSAVRHQYRSWFQYLTLNGFVVFAPNYRGSTGYGKKFETLNDKDWGGAHIKDLVSGKEAMAKLPYVDQNNIFIFGGSFGGYSTLASLTFQPKAFKAAVAFIAIGNLFTFMKSIPPDEAWQTEFKREIGDPIKDKKLYQARSPFFHVEKIVTPLQIYQAENDVRTVKSEMDDFVAELKAKGKDVDYTVLKDVGHELARPESRKQVLEGSVKFFKNFIKSSKKSKKM